MELVKPLAAYPSLGAPLTDDQKSLLEGGPPSKWLHWCMPLPCVAMIHFTDYQSFLQLCLLTFDQRFPFNTRKICLERKKREKAHYREILMAAVFLATSGLLPEELRPEPAWWCGGVDVYCGILWSVVYISMDYYNNKGDIQ